MRIGLVVLSVLAVVLVVDSAHAGVSPFWRELGGSASGDGVSRTLAPKTVSNTAVAVDRDGQSIVVYAEHADASATHGAIVVKRWNRSALAWQTLSGPAGIGNGYQPQVRISPSGSIYVAWLRDDASGNTEVHLRTRAFDRTTFDELDGSDSPGGVMRANTSVTSFSLAVAASGPDDRPTLALLAPAKTGLDVTETPAVIDGTLQVYVVRWTGTTWEFVSPDSGLTTGGASNVTSFAVGPTTFVHGADSPTLALDLEGEPIVAFVYPTAIDGALIGNTDVYVTRWNGAAWVAMGPAVPAAATDPGGRGEAGGVSGTVTASLAPSLAVGGEITTGSTSRIALAWEEHVGPADGPYIWVREWNGMEWVELAGSASGSAFAQPGTVNVTPRLAVDPEGRSVVAWEGMMTTDPAPQVFVRRWNGTDTWEELGFHSATAQGISDASVEAHTPALALTRGGGMATAGLPAVAWLDARDQSSQVFLRQFFAGPTFPLTVNVTGDGSVSSNPVGVECPGASCVTSFPSGTSVKLLPQAGPNGLFGGWSGGCTGAGACTVAMTAARTVNASFVGARTVSVDVIGTGGRVSSGPPGIANCMDSCSAKFRDNVAVTLSAIVNTGGIFGGWGGFCAFRGTNTTCTVALASVNASTVDVSATFALKQYTLTVIPRTNGTVVNLDPLPSTINCGAGGTDCTATLDHGTPVRLQARPIDGSRFVSWTGCTSVVGANCSFTMTANRTVTPTYRDVTRVSLTKTGQGTVTSTPGGISCGLTCSAAAFDFARGTRVTLTPTPPTGWDFIGWSGDPDCPGRLCSFNASTPSVVSVAANFSIQLKTLRVTVVGNGSVTGPGGFFCDASTTPCAQVFPYGTLETLTPAAAPGFKFTGWSQDCAGVAACRPTMTTNHAVTATFKQVFGVTVARQGNGLTAATNITATGINCGLIDCAEDYLSGSVVTFSRSAPPTGRKFRWLGDCAFRGANASCALTINANKSVIGEYSLVPLGLTVNVFGPGTVTGTVSCSAISCPFVVDYGTVVLLQATPKSEPQGEFVRWTGCTTMVGTNCSFTLTANRAVAATFQPTVDSLEVKALSADASVPLAKGARRQYSAIATFSDFTTKDVTASAIWTSGDTSVFTVLRTNGLVTGGNFGTANVSATFSTKTSSASGSLAVTADSIVPDIVVACSPFGGDPTGLLTCLPAGRSFEVECRATGTFAHEGLPRDVTDQAVWTSTNAAIARPLGLSDFGGPIVASFRIFTGIAAIRATLGGVVSSANTSLANRWAVQGTPLAVTGVSVAPPIAPVTVGTPVQLQALATLGPTTGTAATCTSPPARDFSLLTRWTTVPPKSPVASVNFFGLVDPLATGDVTIHWAYPGTNFQGDVPISVRP